MSASHSTHPHGMDPTDLDPLRLPLSGMQVIEASAGTGKTWTLAALYVRLVLGHGVARPLLPPQILVMTFTEAATAELRQRIRQRLAQAARFFAQWPDAGSGEMDPVAPAGVVGVLGVLGVEQGDDFLRRLRAEWPADQWPACASRLTLAAQWMDEAAIHTIHGWSSRTLRQHALDSASLFEQEPLPDPKAQLLQAAQDHWRRWFYGLTPELLAPLQRWAHTPQDMVQALQPVWDAAERDPAHTWPEGPDTAQALAAWAQWNAQAEALAAPARAAWTPELAEHIRALAQAKTFKGVRLDYLEGWLRQMADWARGEDIETKTLQRFRADALQAKGWAQAATQPALRHIEALCDHLDHEPPASQQLQDHAARSIWAHYQAAKVRLAQFDFSDLLQRLFHAVHAPDGALATALRIQYPVALVDEFQDTDPWQYGTLARIYGPSAEQDAAATALVMIGDPKQAIYSFRGADLATYLRARSQAQGVHTLLGNHRSTSALVAAVNHVFSNAAAPFGAHIAFQRIQARSAKAQPLQVAGALQPAFTVWHLAFDAPPTQPQFMQRMSASVATGMVALLRSGAASPGDMAVLVRDRREAASIRQALAERGVPSVYLSDRDSVYASPEASDLWQLLQAVSQPRDTRLLRAALATRAWGLDWTELARVVDSEDAWNGLVERVQQWQAVWQRQGVLPMLYRWLHDEGVAHRLLAAPDGERSLTNLLHLGDLLQTASATLQGEAALLRHLQTHIARPTLAGDAAQLRLESDADLVQVVTVHKSKGLQYPLVFLPFASSFRAESDDAPRSDAERLEEDMRLLYVALTRAERGLWLGVAERSGDADGKKPAQSALSVLLGRQGPGDLPQCLARWALCPPEQGQPTIAVHAAPPADTLGYTPPHAPGANQPARVARRVLRRRWWTASFSRLVQAHASGAPFNTLATPGSALDDRLAEAQLDHATPEDDAPPLANAVDGFPAGARHGTLLHDLLQWQCEHGWPLAQPHAHTQAEPPATPGLAAHDAAWQRLIENKKQTVQLDQAQEAVLIPWLRAIVTQPLSVDCGATPGEPLVLAQLQPHQVWAEMAFTLAVPPTDVAWLDRLIQAHLWPGQPRPALQPGELDGMLTGSMDLVLAHGGRYHVLDYKSNRLAGYAPGGASPMLGAMLQHRYDVQLTLYLLALHRLLRQRLPGYAPQRHLGGAVYLFLRGITGSASAAPSTQGVMAVPAPLELLQRIDERWQPGAAPSTGFNGGRA